MDYVLLPIQICSWLSARKSFSYYPGDVISLTETDNCINAIDLAQKLLTFSFRKTACNNHFFYVTTALSVHSVLYCFE